MTVGDIFTKSSKLVKRNTPEILTGMGVAGVITTAYLTAKAAYVASEVIHSNEDIGGTHADPKERFKERFTHTWRLFVPAALSGTITITCIVAGSRASGKRTAAAITAYSITEKAFTEYKEKVIEQIGATKEQKIRDDLVQDKLNESPPCMKEVIIVAGGHVLCCELYTHRYFRSDMESIRKAVNEINAKIIRDPYVTLNEFYDILGLPYASGAEHIGWDSSRLLELNFTSALSEDNEPCLAFDYNYTKPIT